MDSVHKFLSEEMDSYGLKTVDELATLIYGGAGFDWIRDKENDWDYVFVEHLELEVRSTLEFIRLELSPTALSILDKWDALYKEWLAKGIFFERYADASGGLFTWQRERERAAEWLNRSIPKSHWWYWPPE